MSDDDKTPEIDPKQFEAIVKRLKSDYYILPQEAVKTAGSVIALAVLLGLGVTIAGVPRIAREAANAVATSKAEQVAGEKAAQVASLKAAEVAADRARIVATPLAEQVAINVTERTAADRAAQAVRAEVGRQMGEILPKTIDLVNDVSESIVRDKAEEAASAESSRLVQEWLDKNGGKVSIEELRTRVAQTTELADKAVAEMDRIKGVVDLLDDNPAAIIEANAAKIGGVEAALKEQQGLATARFVELRGRLERLSDWAENPIRTPVPVVPEIGDWQVAQSAGFVLASVEYNKNSHEDGSVTLSTRRSDDVGKTVRGVARADWTRRGFGVCSALIPVAAGDLWNLELSTPPAGKEYPTLQVWWIPVGQ